MATNPRSPEGNHDPAGSTQMFRAFVDEEPVRRPVEDSSGSHLGLSFLVLAVVAVAVTVGWLAIR